MDRIEPQYTEKQHKGAYVLYVARFLLKMAELEMSYGKEDVNKSFQRRFKIISQSIEGLDVECKMRGIKWSEVFSEFKEEKMNALHNSFVMMLNSSEEDCLEIETFIEKKLNLKKTCIDEK